MSYAHVLVFGTFDGLHAGHEAFLAWAKKQGTRLTIVLAHDAMVQTLKGHAPRIGHDARKAELCARGVADEVLIGDPLPGAWSVFTRVMPDVIALGYDQMALRDALLAYKRAQKLSFAIIMCPFAKEPERLHSSHMRSPRV